jgi:hypothetical protein
MEDNPRFGAGKTTEFGSSMSQVGPIARLLRSSLRLLGWMTTSFASSARLLGYLSVFFGSAAKHFALPQTVIYSTGIIDFTGSRGV